MTRNTLQRRILPPEARPPIGKKRGCRGQTVVEFALVAIPFFFLMFAIIDYSWALFNQMNVQDAVREAGRYAATGRYVTPTNGAALSRIASIEQVLNEFALGNGANIQSVSISSVSAGTGTITTGSAGAPGDTVTITATCAVPMLTNAIGHFFNADGRYHFTASATFKNEPFPASGD
jgi:Flp pilus assembly protein TadG